MVSKKVTAKMPVSLGGNDVRLEIFNRSPLTIYETGLVTFTLTLSNLQSVEFLIVHMDPILF